MADKTIKVKVEAEADGSGLKPLESEIKKLKTEKLQLKVEAKTQELNQAETELNELKSKLAEIEAVPPHLRVNVDDAGVDNLRSEIASVENKVANLQVDVDMAELEVAKSEIEALDGENIDVQLNNQSAMEGISQIADGFSRLKQSAGELGQQMGDILASAGKQETNMTFLEQAVGDPAVAKQKMDEIKDIITDLPGDDTSVQGLLSQAVAKDASLANDQLKAIGTAYADYASAMSFYGKSSTEAQQDMTNYILAGNTAELERSPILASHIDQLKEANTIQERAEVLQKALNEEHWGGMSQQDTYNNKLETFMGMIDRGKYNLGGMFQEGAKGAMDFLIKLDDASGGIVGMGIALGGFASPLFEGAMGIGQMATGIKAIKDLGFIQFFKDLEIAESLSAVATWAQNSALWGMIAPILANPLTWLVIALIALAGALIWAYQNVDWFRAMVDNAWASITQFAGVLWNSLVSAFNYVSTIISNFTNNLGLNSKNWIQAILGFILFLPTLPLRIGIALANAIARVLGFKGNFVNQLRQSAINAVNGFSNAIRGIGTALQNCLNWAVQIVMSHPLVQKLIWLGNKASEVFSKIGLGQASPGKIVKAMRQELDWTEEAIMDSSLPNTTAKLGENIVGGFGNPMLDVGINGNDVGNNNMIGGGDIIINVGSVDNDERVNEIVNAVTRALSWDNRTAGRTV